MKTEAEIGTTCLQVEELPGLPADTRSWREVWNRPSSGGTNPGNDLDLRLLSSTTVKKEIFVVLSH